jgi:hypothetical protein
MSNTPIAQTPSYFETALPIAHIVPLSFRGGTLCVVWVSATAEQPLVAWHTRRAAVGDQAAHLNQTALQRALGRAQSHWVYDRDLFPNALFIHLAIEAPAVVRPFLKLSAQRTECLLRLELAEKETAALLHSMAASRSFFLRFDASPPAWVSSTAHLQAEDERLDHLLLSSLPVNFSAEGIALLSQHLAVWHAGQAGER